MTRIDAKRPRSIPTFRGLLSALSLVFLLVTACGGGGRYVWVWDLPPTPKVVEPLSPGDRVQVAVQGQDTLSGEFEVRAEGDIVLPTAGRFRAAGLTPERLAVEITTRLRGMLTDPKVTVVIATRGVVGVGVLGEVRTPSRYELRPGEGVLDALARAGGLTPFADSDAVFVVRKGAPHRIRFRYSALTAADAASLAFQLRDGDVVVVE